MKILFADRLFNFIILPKKWGGKKIVFCYFHPSKKQNYTPLDIGFIITLIKDRYPKSLSIIEEMSFNKENENSEILIEKDTKAIKNHSADAVFFFLDDIFWSGGYAFIRARKIAEKLKRETPDIFIGFQSYKMTEDEAKEVNASGVVDCTIRGNPTIFFQNLDDNIEKLKLKHKGHNGRNYKDECAIEFENNGSYEKSLDFTSSSSPYLSGTMDEFLVKKQQEFKGNFKAYVYSSVGCPFRCLYCFRGVRSDKIRFSSPSHFYDELEYLFVNFGIRRFMLLDDVFIINKERLEEFVGEFKKRKMVIRDFENISLSAMIRPELVSENFIPLLKEINIRWLQLGLQTINPDLQHYMGRGISISELENIMKRIVQNGIGLYLDVIMGLPNDTLEYFKKTMDFALGLRPTALQIFQFRFNPGTYFYQHRNHFNIIAENSEREFFVPFVCKAAGEINENYFAEAIKFTEQKINEFPEVYWALTSAIRRYASPGFW